MLSLAVCVFTKMHRYLIAALSLAALLGSAWAGNSSCHCSKPTLCNRVQYDQKEVHGIILKTNEKVWSHFNWTKLTTVTLIDFFDEKLLCVAHEHNVRVLTQERFALEHVENSSYVNNWLAGRIQWVQHHFTDGIHLLVDDPLPKGHILASKLTQFAQLVTKTFHEKVPGSIVVFNVPYSPYNEQKNGVDGRNYDFLGLSRAVDQFFINDFNHRRQSFEERCLAGANSNFYYTMGGILAYESLNVSMDKLVLGVPYFAYDYECLEYAENLRCYIQPKSYRGSHCSSDVALMVPQNELFRTYALRGEFFDEHSSTIIYNYVSQPYGVVHQVWYERNTTLILKYNQAAEHGLLGVGMWALNYLDHGSWAYIPHIKNKAIH